MFQEKPTIKIELLSAKHKEDSFDHKSKTTPPRLPVQSYDPYDPYEPYVAVRQPPLPPRSNVVTRLDEQSNHNTKF